MWVVARLPIGVIFALGSWLGHISMHIAKSRRRITEVNLAKCFPELNHSERQALVRRNFRHTGIGMVETAIPWLNPKRNILGRCKVEGLEHYREAQFKANQNGGGIVLMGTHFTCIDIASQKLAELGDIDAMYRPNKNPVWEWLQTNGRKNFFQSVINRHDLRQTLKRLRQGGTIWYAADQDYGRKYSTFAPFFGVQTSTITMGSRLAAKHSSQVLMLRQTRDIERRQWTLSFTPIFTNFGQGDDAMDAANLNAALEQHIRRFPDQYLWVHKRFKTRPEGEPGFY